MKQIRNIRKSLCWHEPDSLTRPQSSLFGTHGENSSLPLRSTEPGEEVDSDVLRGSSRVPAAGGAGTRDA